MSVELLGVETRGIMVILIGHGDQWNRWYRTLLELVGRKLHLGASRLAIHQLALTKKRHLFLVGYQNPVSI